MGVSRSLSGTEEKKKKKLYVEEVRECILEETFYLKVSRSLPDSEGEMKEEIALSWESHISEDILAGF